MRVKPDTAESLGNQAIFERRVKALNRAQKLVYESGARHPGCDCRLKLAEWRQQHEAAIAARDAAELAMTQPLKPTAKPLQRRLQPLGKAMQQQVLAWLIELCEGKDGYGNRLLGSRSTESHARRFGMGVSYLDVLHTWRTVLPGRVKEAESAYRKRLKEEKENAGAEA